MYVHCKVDSGLFCKVCEMDGDMFSVIPLISTILPNLIKKLDIQWQVSLYICWNSNFIYSIGSDKQRINCIICVILQILTREWVW